MTPPPPPNPGADRRHFQIIRLLGAGGMGQVYLARDTVLHRTVALKAIRPDLAPDPSLRAAFLREARLAAGLEHPGIVPIYALGQDADGVFLVMRYVRSETLGDRLRREGSLPEAIVTGILRQLAEILSYAHDEGVVHRDLKPDNIFLEGDPANPRPVLSDFGVAHRAFADQGPGQRRLAFGTPHYMSPEQSLGEFDVDGRSDIFSLGVLGYQMATGALPYDGPSERAIAAARIRGDRPPLGAEVVSPAFAAAVAKCLAPDPHDRFARAADLAQALGAIAPLPSRRRRFWPRGARPTTPRPLSLPIATAVRSPEPTAQTRFDMDRFVRDARYTLRSLRQTPAVAVAAILCVALGIGATTSTFSAVSRALLTSLPFRAPDRLVSVFRTTPHFDRGPFSAPNYSDLAAGTRTLSSLAAIGNRTALLERTDGSISVRAHRVSGNWFTTLGVEPLIGRLLAPADGDASQPAVTVVSEEFWRDRLGADRNLIGQVVRLDGEPFTVVGVVRAGFQVPSGGQLFRSDFWTALRFSTTELGQRRNNYLILIGRLAEGAFVAGAQSEFSTAMNGLIAAHPELAGEGLTVVPLHRESTRYVRGPLLLLLGAVGLVLLVAAANVASLLLARNVEREREVSVRVALGAAREDIVRRIVIEIGLVVGTGTVLGIGLAWAGTRVIGALAAAQLPQLGGMSVDLRVLLFSVVLAILTGVLCGWAPASRALRADPQAVLRAAGRGGKSLEQLRFLGGLSSAQVALSLTLLVGTGLVTRGFVSLVDRPPGFDPERLLYLRVTVPPGVAGTGAVVSRFADPVAEAIRSVAGVTSVGVVNMVPYNDWGNNFNVVYEGQTGGDPSSLPLVENRLVTPGFFEVMGLRPTRGRLFEPDDLSPDRPLVVVANQALVDRDFPGQDPVGRRFHLSDTAFGTIIGVVPNIRNVGPTRAPSPEFYYAIHQSSGGTTTYPFLIRTAGDPIALAAAITAAVRGVEPRAAVGTPRRMTDVIARSVGTPRFYLVLLGTFSAVAVAMALAGLYGVMSYGVALRRREIGIRSALGSTAGRTIAFVARQGATLVVTGLAAGAAASLAATRLLGGLLYGVSPLDPVTWLAVVGMLVGAAAVAIAIPARRATRVDPLEAIRVE